MAATSGIVYYTFSILSAFTYHEAFILFCFLETPSWFGWSSYISHEETKPREFGLWDCVGLPPGSQSFLLFSAFLPRLGLWLSEPICPARFLSLYHKPWARRPLWGSGWEGEASCAGHQPVPPSLRVIYGLSGVWVLTTCWIERFFVLGSENNPKINVGAGRAQGCWAPAALRLLPGAGLNLGETGAGFGGRIVSMKGSHGLFKNVT